MFHMTDHLMRSADQQLWNNPGKREELWAANGGADKLVEASQKEDGGRQIAKKVKTPLNDYEKAQRNDKIKVRIAVILSAIIIAAMVVLIILEGM